VKSETGRPSGGRLTRRCFVRGVGAAAAIGATSSLPALAAGGRAAQIASLLGVDPKYAGKGLQIDIGGVFPLTGGGAAYANRFPDAAHLAFKHILEMGGPTFTLQLKDNKSGDPQAGVDAVRELGFAKVPMELSSYAADLGSMLPGIAQYRILSLDGSGGTSDFAQGKPYYYGTIAITPDDAIPGAVKFVKAKFPHVKRVAFVGWDLGELSNKVFAHIKQLTAPSGMQIVANELTAIGEDDYSDTLQKVKLSNPDMVFIAIYAEDSGYFMKQYGTSGINKPVMAFAHTDIAARIGGSGYNGLYFAFDFFDATRPKNPWAKFFVDEYASVEPGWQPDYYVANTYEDVFMFWECVRRVLKAKGNPHDGTQLNRAFQSDLTFPSLYGGSSSSPGTISINAQTHSPSSRPMSVSQYMNGRVTPLASFNIGGTDFRLL